MKTRVAVMMPVYNGSKLIPTAMASVLTQTYSDIFPIVYDDGSTDNTREVLVKMAETDGRITILPGEINRGLPAADNALREYIINKTDYKLIAWLAADDQWRRDKTEAQVAFMDSSGVDISYTDTVFIQGTTANATQAPEFDINSLLRVNFINGSSIMMKRSVLEELSWNEEFRNCEDWDFYLRCYKEGFTFGHLKGPYTMNLRHSENLSKNREREAYYHAKVCLAHRLPIEIPAERMIRIGDPSMIRGIMRAWIEAKEKL